MPKKKFCVRTEALVFVHEAGSRCQMSIAVPALKLFASVNNFPKSRNCNVNTVERALKALQKKRLAG